jgi:hypothetical protein
VLITPAPNLFKPSSPLRAEAGLGCLPDRSPGPGPRECYKTRDYPVLGVALSGLFQNGRFEEKVTEWSDCNLRGEGTHQSLAAGFRRLAVAHVGVDHRVRDVLVAGPLLDGVHVRVLRGHHGAERVPERMRVQEMRRDASGASVFAEQPKELHPREHSALLAREKNL